MGDCGYKNNGVTSCIVVGIVLSIIAGVAVGLLFSAELIPAVLNFVTIALIASAVSMVILVFSLYASNSIRSYNGFYKCICTFANVILAGSIGTLLAGTIALTIGLTATLITSVIFVALTAFFFVLMITSLICFITCIIKHTCICAKEE